MYGVFLCGYILNDPSVEERERERKLGHNYLPICWLGTDLIWLKHVNSDAN